MLYSEYIPIKAGIYSFDDEDAILFVGENGRPEEFRILKSGFRQYEHFEDDVIDTSCWKRNNSSRKWLKWSYTGEVYEPTMFDALGECEYEPIQDDIEVDDTIGDTIGDNE